MTEEAKSVLLSIEVASGLKFTDFTCPTEGELLAMIDVINATQIPGYVPVPRQGEEAERRAYHAASEFLALLDEQGPQILAWWQEAEGTTREITERLHTGSGGVFPVSQEHWT